MQTAMACLARFNSDEDSQMTLHFGIREVKMQKESTQRVYMCIQDLFLTSLQTSAFVYIIPGGLIEHELTHLPIYSSLIFGVTQ
jgi:hypothetical protein